MEKIIDKLILEQLDTVLTAVDDRHLSCRKEGEQYIPNYSERKNRQYLPLEYRETGAVLASKRTVISPK